MPVEFALRPRIRLREDPAPARRARPRLPKFALPALAYWVAIGGLVYAFVRQHDANPPLAEAEAALAPLAPASPVIREWWRPTPAPVAPPSAPPLAEPRESAPAEEPPFAGPAPAQPASEFAEPAPELTENEEAPAVGPTPPLARAGVRAVPDRRSALTQRAVPPAVDPDLPALASAPLAFPTLAPSRAPTPDLFPSPSLAPTASPSPSPAPGGLPSCEEARAAASQDVDFSGGNRTADLPTQAIAAVLENGAWLSSCAVPEQTSLDICVAIKGGRVVGASVSSRPASAALNSCVKRRASSLQFPYSPHLDIARTRF